MRQSDIPVTGAAVKPKSARRRGTIQPEGDWLKAFHLGYLAAAARLRRGMPLAWRAMVLNVLRFDPLDRDDSADDTREVLRYAPSLRGSSLAVARCEAAATMLAWHKDLQPRQQEALRQAVESVVAQARRLGAA